MASDKRKVVILGAGHVGSHCAYALAAAGDCQEIVLVDIVPGKAAAQALDVADSVSFMSHTVAVREGSYHDCADADLVVVGIGEPRKPGQTRLDLLDRSVEMLDELADQLAPVTITCPVVTITNPADIFADYLRKALGMPRSQCFSTGTLLDTARLVRCISQDAGVAHGNVAAFCLGEHGDSSMVAFSCASVAGRPFDDLGLSKEDILNRVHASGMDIIEGKGSTEFGIGRAMAELARCILRDEQRVMPVSVLLEGEYGQAGVHCGVPCRIGRAGVEEIIELPLSNEEQRQLDASCRVIADHIARAAAKGHLGALSGN